MQECGGRQVVRVRVNSTSTGRLSVQVPLQFRFRGLREREDLASWSRLRDEACASRVEGSGERLGHFAARFLMHLGSDAKHHATDWHD